MSGNSKNKDKFLFVPTPRQLNRNDFINYNKNVVVAHWKAATAASRKDSELYDCTLKGLSRASRVELMLMGGGKRMACYGYPRAQKCLPLRGTCWMITDCSR